MEFGPEIDVSLTSEYMILRAYNEIQNNIKTLEPSELGYIVMYLADRDKYELKSVYEALKKVKNIVSYTVSHYKSGEDYRYNVRLVVKLEE